jgi:hypothetical protein
LFGDLKEQLEGTQMYSEDQVIYTVREILEGILIEVPCKVPDEWIHRLRSCIEVDGDCPF